MMVRMSNQKLWLVISLSVILGLVIAWGVVRFAPCEVRGEPTPAPWPTILEQDPEHETKAVAVDMASDQTSDPSTQ